MAGQRRLDVPEVYEAASRWVDAALESQDSLFTPGEPIWSPRWLDDFHARFVESPDESARPFLEKLTDQLRDAPHETVQLAAEALFFHLLTSEAITAESKRRTVETILSFSDRAIHLPDALLRALEQGLVNPGAAFNTQRYYQLCLLIKFCRHWWSLTDDRRAEALRDPWVFKQELDTQKVQKSVAQHDALLHFVHPDTFEPIVSRSAKKRIVRAFSDLVVTDSADLDRQLLDIREKLGHEYGADFKFWDPLIAPRWRPDSSRWGLFVHWANRFYASPDFDGEERDYKLLIGDRLTRAREKVLRGEDWFGALKAAFGSPNNLTSWRANGRFLEWCKTEPESAKSALVSLWSGRHQIGDAVQTFLEKLPISWLSGPGTRTSLVSFLAMGIDPTEYPIYRTTVYQKAFELTDYPRPASDTELDIYLHALGFLDQFAEEASSRGLEIRDRLDAQSLVFLIAKGTNTDAILSEAEAKAFRRYRGEGAVDDDDADDTTTTDQLSALATRLLFDVSYLKRIVDLLEHKGQAAPRRPAQLAERVVALRDEARAAGIRSQNT